MPGHINKVRSKFIEALEDWQGANTVTRSTQSLLAMYYIHNLFQPKLHMETDNYKGARQKILETNPYRYIQ